MNQRAYDVCVKRLLVRESFDIFGRMRIDVLEGPCQFVIKTFRGGDYAARDLKDLTWSRLRRLLIVFPFLCIFNHHVGWVSLQDFKKVGKFSFKYSVSQ